MKHTLLFFIISLNLILLSCSKDNNDTPTPAFDYNLIIGNWQAKDIKLNDVLLDKENLTETQLQVVESCAFDGRVNFMPDKKYEEYDGCNEVTYKGTWEIKSSWILITFQNQTLPVGVTPKEMTGNTLSLITVIYYPNGATDQIEIFYTKIK